MFRLRLSVLDRPWVPTFFASIVVGMYVFSGIVRSWFNPSGAHGQRQVDTLGLSVAFHSDVSMDGWKALFNELLYPKVLQRGLSSGINASEFPLLNVLAEPFFRVGLHAGALSTTLIVLAFNLVAALVFAPRLLKALQIQVAPWIPALLYFSITSIHFQASIPMPEGLSFALLVIGSALWLENIETRFSWRSGLSVIAFSLAVAIKPPAVVGLVPVVFLQLFPHRTLPRVGQRYFEWAALAIAISFPAWWYTLHAKEILRRVDGIQVFALARFQPLVNLGEVGLRGVLDLLIRQISREQFPFLTGFYWFALCFVFPKSRKWAGLLVVGIVGAIALDGPHIWPHFYYFFGANLIALIAMSQVLECISALEGRSGKLLRGLAVLFVFWGVVYGVRGNIWQTARTPDTWTAALKVRDSLLPFSHLVTDDEVDATKLIFLGRPGTIAGRHIGEICRDPAYRALQIDLVVDEENWRRYHYPGDCFSSSSLITIGGPGAPWRLYRYR